MITFLKRWLLAMVSVIAGIAAAVLACWAVIAASIAYGWEWVALVAFFGGTALAALAQQANKEV